MSSKPEQSNFDEKLSSAIGLVLGLLFIAGGLWVRNIQANEHATLNETQGTVVSSVSRRERSTTNNQERETYAPVIEFFSNGERMRFTGKYDSYRLSTGHTVTVRYDSTRPTDTARVVDPLEGLTSWAMLGMGGLGVIDSLFKLLPLRTLFSRG